MPPVFVSVSAVLSAVLSVIPLSSTLCRRDAAARPAENVPSAQVSILHVADEGRKGRGEGGKGV